MLNKRVDVGFSADSARRYTVCLTTINQTAAEINSVRLLSLKAKIYRYDAKMTGDFKDHSYPI